MMSDQRCQSTDVHEELFSVTIIRLGGINKSISI